MSDGLKRVAKDASWLASDQLAGLAIGVAVGIVVAGLIGPQQLGILAYASAAYAMVAPAIQALDPMMIRRFAATDTAGAFLVASRRIYLVLGLLGLGVVVLLALLRWRETPVLLATLLAGLPLLFSSWLLAVPWLIAQGRARSLARIRLFTSSSVGLARIGLALVVGTAIAQQAATAAGGFLGALLAFRVAKIESLSRGEDREPAAVACEFRAILREGWPFVLSAVAVALYSSSDQLLLGLLATDWETGQYALAARLLSVAFALPAALAMATAPSIARARANDPLKYQRQLQRLASYSVGGAVMVGVAVLGLAFGIMRLGLGDEYAPALTLLIIMLPSCVFVAMGVTRSQWIVNEQRARFGLVSTAGGAVLNVLLNLWAIPMYGASGAAMTTVVSYFAATVVSSLVYRPAWAVVPVLFAALNPLLTWQFLREDLRSVRAE